MKYLLVVVVLLLSGCGEETKSVDWWRNHPEDAMKQADECKKSGADTENCKNVKAALFRNKQQDAPVPTFN
ncbi:TPA: EexN family lipoprotein [Citrobacter freundii]|uniref:EexN family lipoprotein n=1 Tax=Citrobacter freundii TaxID=546 RepID=UPI001E025881|nr:EexN family lipoprotein [Citrobacter freundii]EAR1644316.1 acetyltransferase [Salmonella enterica]EDQ4123549.1 EexN family lipoprotein [Salmonella enterica subsp. enterica serovar Sandiego]EGJ4124589.1 EexN family lipoprotein [Salmonella enterica]EGM4617330.1 EexN family lipoprotein [Salmonella enterica]EJA1307277.1 EexN family lipoprotein [Salmonella enterica]